MKKTLNNIFDGATPHELDVFSDNLNAKELPSETLTAVKQKVYEKNKLSKKSTTRAWARALSLAACFALILSAVIVAPLLKDDEPIPPAVSTVVSGNKLTGVQELTYGDDGADDSSSLNLELIPPGFWIHTVVEAEVVEVLPDTYYCADYYYIDGSRFSVRVAKLRVIDAIRGEGLPSEIYLRYAYYGTDIFEGYERFIFSVTQTGVENFLLVNQTQGRVEYFPNMFEVTEGDLGYGSVIAFNDGVVDASFWDSANYLNAKYHNTGWVDNFLSDPDRYHYPVGYDSTIAEAKERILARVASSEYANDCHSVTAEDIFVSDEQKELKAYLQPSENNTFSSHITVGSEGRVIATYTRLINGFSTNEKLVLNSFQGENGNVIRYGESFSPDDLAKVPDIGEAMAGLNLPELQPPHTELKEGMEFKYSRAQGFYRKVDGKVYGIIRIQWRYYVDAKREGDKFYFSGYIMDDCYYLYDSEGNGSIVEREELREIIGND
ncbi:MAG: hypothetical protein IJW09_07770 [Clostridia bacterium]|nr:hypothetical protein [Clostridia bacterium]